MTDNRFALVEFQGSKHLTIFDGESVRVAMKPLVEALGIDWVSQYKRIQRDPLLSEGMVIMTIPSERGMQETATLPIDLMHGWLFTLTVSKVREDARERILAYQRECYQVLHDYWVKGAALNPRAGAASSGAVQDILKLLDAVKRERNPAAKRMIYAMLEQAGSARGVEVPALEALSPTVNEDAEADALLVRIDALLADRPDLDHHRRTELIAVRPRELAEAGVLISKAMREALRRHPRYQAEVNVNSAQTGSGVWSMVFRAA